MKKAGLFILGFALVVWGMSLVLREWDAVVTVFKGGSGGALAVLGLVLLFSATIKK